MTTYRAGTLVYSKLGLLALFGWLLGGDFVFNLMEIVAGNFIPLKLKYLEAPNWLIGLVVTTVPSVIGMTVTPVISVSSDRTRTRWGRRMPYLLAATPFVALSLVLIGTSDSLGSWLQIAGFPGSSVAAVTLWTVCLLVVGFQFLNVFVTNIYFYLFNDVVPPELMSRFMALFRIVSIAATSGFQFFLFGKAGTHMREIFLGSAALYAVVFSLMCLRVREGRYDEPPQAPEGDATGLWKGARRYVVECFTERFYWYFFLANMFWGLGFAVVSFRVFFAESVGLSLDDFGRLMGCVGVITAALLYPAAALADRLHPLRVMLLGLALLLLVVPFQLIFVVVDIPSAYTRGLYMALFALHITVQTLCMAAQMPMFMKLLPKDRFGQFASANGFVTSAAMMLGGVLAGVWLDRLDASHIVPLYQYRYLPVWVSACLGLCLFFMMLLYREWKRRGGEAS